MAILQAFGFMFGHGAGSNIARKLGNHDISAAKVYASTSFWASILSGLGVMILGMIFMEPLVRLLGSTDTILPLRKRLCLLYSNCRSSNDFRLCHEQYFTLRR